MAGDPDLTELLVGLGLDELSMSAVTVPAVKQRVTEVDTATASERAEAVAGASTREQAIDRLRRLEGDRR
jgi:phosphotransferase system enzyme I (PtsI)